MRKLIITVIIVALGVLSIQANMKVKLHTIGDSTMEKQNPNIKDQRGWVQMLQSFFNDDLEIMDGAKSGTSTKTFYRNGFWDKAKKNIQPGDYVLIQFGHNDEKHNGKDGETGTVPTDSFRIYLSKYITEIRNLGATPILCTPVVRKMFDRNGKLSRRGMHDIAEAYKQKVDPTFNDMDTFAMNYSANMKYIATEMKCPVIDMTTSTTKLVENMGNSKAEQFIYNLPNDGTHFGSSGALYFSKLFVDELKNKGILLDYLNPNKKLITNPARIECNEVFAGTEFRQVFDVGYITNQISKNNFISIKSTKGLFISQFPDSLFANELKLNVKSLIGTHKLYGKSIQNKAGEFNELITVSDNLGECNKIEVHGLVKEIGKCQTFSVSYKLSGSVSAEVQGAVTALDELWKGMSFIEYTAGNPTISKVQKSNITGAWPMNEIDVVYSRYVQFGLKTPPALTGILNSVELTLGGGVNFRVVGATTVDFSDAFTIGENANVGSKDLTKYTYKLSQSIGSGKKLYIRIYPWGNKKISNQSLLVYNVIMKGITQQ